MAKIKILFLHQSADLYGSDVTLLQLIKGLNREHFDCTVIVPMEGPLVAALEKYGARVFIIDMPIIARGMFNVKGIFAFFIKLVRSLIRLKRLIKDYNINLIHSVTLAVSFGGILSRIFKIRHIWHIHEIIVHPPSVRFLFPWLIYLTSDVAATNSLQTAGWLRDVCPKIDKKTKVIFNGVDNCRFNPEIERDSFRKELSIHSDEILVCLIGRIKRWKGQGIFAEAAELVLKEIEKIYFVIVGDPPHNQEHFLVDLEKALETLPMASRKVKIIPFRQDIEKIYAASDIVAVPSTEPEAFGLVAAEAMAMGKAVIASAHGGLLDIVVDGSTGILVKPGDLQELAKAILNLAKDNVLRERMGRNGLERQKALFSADKYVKEFSKLYCGMIL